MSAHQSANPVDQKSWMFTYTTDKPFADRFLRGKQPPRLRHRHETDEKAWETGPRAYGDYAVPVDLIIR